MIVIVESSRWKSLKFPFLAFQKLMFFGEICFEDPDLGEENFDYCLYKLIQIKYAADDVSMLVISARMKFISFRVFSRIIFGSCEVQRRRFGAKTIARFDESIFVQATTSGWANSCRKWIRYVST